MGSEGAARQNRRDALVPIGARAEHGFTRALYRVTAAPVELVRSYSNIEVIWASPREFLSIFQADAIGCHTITATNDILAKLHLVGKDLHEYSLETVKMFREDAVKAGFTL